MCYKIFALMANIKKNNEVFNIMNVENLKRTNTFAIIFLIRLIPKTHNV